ncbi:hypothetical protein ACOBQX_10375 [Actinokineospora sp. G85]|uniref:hypothetical protein n=1 Tax=Actinokineospora sp. G85 TaxID=3406626 RepID=UPI003C71362D
MRTTDPRHLHRRHDHERVHPFARRFGAPDFDPEEHDMTPPFPPMPQIPRSAGPARSGAAAPSAGEVAPSTGAASTRAAGVGTGAGAATCAPPCSRC